MHSEAVTVGIVGLGGIGSHHANCLQKQDRAALVGGLDVEEDARARFGEAFGVETYSEPESLFDRVDAVIVTTPNAFHEEYAVAALERGLSVLVEKPLAHDLESAEAIAAAATDAPGICMVGFHNRFEPTVEALASYREHGFFGSISHVDATYVRRRGIPGHGSWFTDLEVAGGGALIDLGVHAIDLALYLTGFPDVVEVSGVTRSEFGTREAYVDVDNWGEGDGEFTVDDSVTAQLRTAGGTTISVDIAWASNRQREKSLRLRGTEGGAYLDLDGDLTLFESSPQGIDHHRTIDIEVGADEPGGHFAEQTAFVDAVAEGRRPTRNTVEQALTVQRTIDAIYRSSERGEAVRPE